MHTESGQIRPIGRARTSLFRSLSTCRWICHAALVAACILGVAPTASAQSSDGWDVTVYPVLGWLPLGIDINVQVPPSDGGAGGAGEIVDGRFDGAFLGGISVAGRRLRVDADILWAAVGGDRPESPVLTVDADLIFGRVVGGFEVAPDFYVTGGVRRLALDYAVRINDQPEFSRKPGIWDPLVGIGWHRVGNTIEWHAVAEGGGFGVGAEVDFGAGFRMDWKPITHFGITAGYNFQYLEVENTVANRTFTIKQTLHGPLLGIGFYF